MGLDADHPFRPRNGVVEDAGRKVHAIPDRQFHRFVPFRQPEGDGAARHVNRLVVVLGMGAVDVPGSVGPAASR